MHVCTVLKCLGNLPPLVLSLHTFVHRASSAQRLSSSSFASHTQQGATAYFTSRKGSLDTGFGYKLHSVLQRLLKHGCSAAAKPAGEMCGPTLQVMQYSPIYIRVHSSTCFSYPCTRKLLFMCGCGFATLVAAVYLYVYVIHNKAPRRLPS